MAELWTSVAAAGAESRHWVPTYFPSHRLFASHDPSATFPLPYSSTTEITGLAPALRKSCGATLRPSTRAVRSLTAQHSLSSPTPVNAHCTTSRPQPQLHSPQHAHMVAPRSRVTTHTRAATVKLLLAYSFRTPPHPPKLHLTPQLQIEIRKSFYEHYGPGAVAVNTPAPARPRTTPFMNTSPKSLVPIVLKPLTPDGTTSRSGVFSSTSASPKNSFFVSVIAPTCIAECFSGSQTECQTLRQYK